jgi:hypothetical protein
MEHLQLPCSTQILSRSHKAQYTLGPWASSAVRPIRGPLEPAKQSPLRSRLPRRGPRQRTTPPPRSRVADLPSEGRPSPPRSRVANLPSEGRPSPNRSRLPLGRWN